jgi:hypothetical protein
MVSERAHPHFKGLLVTVSWPMPYIDLKAALLVHGDVAERIP